ncbi:hypothetical protein I553_5805 [Mycobacterium xenopi 4042]|uniref:Uncharacterized protein n=1 Tax=Mycobacterium xenopi 4042 TaxID=1299334 RepID=X7ZVV7_MYCXE|nr:hypothetical protein I553_5805 [Mycobacterium xenopi 4042]EUA24181.1 hypothetical protein I552_3183 [Mycobacterium xenopi 3993]
MSSTPPVIGSQHAEKSAKTGFVVVGIPVMVPILPYILTAIDL